jgi:hypothetical protein
MNKIENELKVILEKESINEMAFIDNFTKIFSNDSVKNKLEEMIINIIENNPNVLNKILEKLKIKIELEKK